MFSNALTIVMAQQDKVVEATNTVRFWIVGALVVIGLVPLIAAFMKKNRTLFFMTLGLLLLLISFGVAPEAWIGFMKNVTENLLT